MINLYFMLYLLRFHNLIIAGGAVLISSFLIDVSYSNHLVHQSVIVTTLMLALANIMNNFLDTRADTINKPHRVLLNNLFNKTQLLICATFIIIILFYSINFNIFAKIALYLLVVPLIVVYNIYFQKKPLIGNIVVSVLLGAVFLFTELVINGGIEKTYVPFCLAFFLTLIREIIKDLHDYSGDKEAKMQTLPIIIGTPKTNQFLIILIILSMIVFILPYMFFNYTQEYIYLLIIFIEIPLLYFLFLLVKSPSKKTYSDIAGTLKLLNIIGLLIIMYTKN